MAEAAWSCWLPLSAGGGARTRKPFQAGDFKSPVFTRFTTPARAYMIGARPPITHPRGGAGHRPTPWAGPHIVVRTPTQVRSNRPVRSFPHPRPVAWGCVTAHSRRHARTWNLKSRDRSNHPVPARRSGAATQTPGFADEHGSGEPLRSSPLHREALVQRREPSVASHARWPSQDPDRRCRRFCTGARHSDLAGPLPPVRISRLDGASGHRDHGIAWCPSCLGPAVGAER